MRKLQMLAASASLLTALAVGGALSSCEKHAQELPEPAATSADVRNNTHPTDLLQPTGCSIHATVRRYVTADSCRGFVLQLADSARTRLRPTGPLWRSFQARDGQRVRFGYVADSTRFDSTGCRGPVRLIGRPVRITCIRPDSAGFNASSFRPAALKRGVLR